MNYTNAISTAQQSLSLLATASTNGNVQADAVKRDSGAEVSGLVRNDAATLTSVGGALARAVQGSDSNAEKVAALQQAIATGTYNVPASAVADKLIESLGR